MTELPTIFRTSWDAIHAQEEYWRQHLTDVDNYLFLDFETFYSNDYSLTK